jgi:L-aspartate semialdehyde sulfurtransferase
MPAATKNIAQINARIMAGEATVLSAAELGNGTAQDVDVVTLAYQAPISGSSAMLVVPVAGRGVFTRAAKIWLNGIQGFPGPAPNERLGLVDTLIFADQKSKDGKAEYTGSQLLPDIIENKLIHTECISVEGDKYESDFNMKQVQFARMYVYNSFIPETSSDEHFKTIRAGSRILLNNAQGTVIGCGTRDAPGRQSLSLTAEMFDMDPSLLLEDGGGLTNSIALAVPILDDTVLASLCAWAEEQYSAGTDNEKQTQQIDVAKHLKELVRSGEFFLTDSDMELGN